MKTLWRPSVRLRLTLTYSTLFLVTGVALLGTSYLLFRHHETASGTTESVICSGHAAGSGSGSIVQATPVSLPPVSGHQSCSAVVSSSGAFPLGPAGTAASSGQVQAYFFSRLADTVRASQDDAVNTLLVVAELALAIMTVVSLALGWWVSGRVLRPVHRITETARRLSEETLHDRIDLVGPDDELKELADTFDDMIGRLDQAFTSQRRFVANASHELRTPLATERVLLDEALMTDAGPDQTRLILEQLLANNQETVQLIDALLTLARSEQGVPARQPVDLAGVANNAADRVAPEAARAGIEVLREVTPATTAGDPGLVERLAANLVDNAVRYNVPGGWVSVATAATAAGATLTVTNTGPPVAADDIPGLMEPFRRGGGDRSSTGPGHGLGLSIVSAIARAHRARLTVVGRDEGGLQVTVTFPPG